MKTTKMRMMTVATATFLLLSGAACSADPTGANLIAPPDEPMDAGPHMPSGWVTAGAG